ncbi:MAG TPA: hypothetical protein VHU87_00805 [Rhizomicrobium sp.]|nr:hypothetical protein [Rhizomicrobium sp.]
MRVFLAGLLSIFVMTGAAYAQDSGGEVVVITSSRINDEGAPHIFMVRRADHLITSVRVTCDTRDEKQRREELKATLREMVRAAAGTKTISLGLGDQILEELNESDFDGIIAPDTRPDTSQMVIVVKTAVSRDDTLDTATARVRDFIEKTPKVGRTELIRENRWDLALIGPEQYRDGLIARIVADARHTADLFGSGYGITIEGLERPVTWYQKGPLDLALYIPYTLHIAPGH